VVVDEESWYLGQPGIGEALDAGLRVVKGLQLGLPVVTTVGGEYQLRRHFSFFPAQGSAAAQAKRGKENERNLKKTILEDNFRRRSARKCVRIEALVVSSEYLWIHGTPLSTQACV